jgi:hypothetical protein
MPVFYNREDAVNALEDLWDLLVDQKWDLAKEYPPELQELVKKHKILQELAEFGPNGPVGLGIGRIGGHAVGED